MLVIAIGGDCGGGDVAVGKFGRGWTGGEVI